MNEFSTKLAEKLTNIGFNRLRAHNLAVALQDLTYSNHVQYICADQGCTEQEQRMVALTFENLRAGR
jgi:hypothetical protein